MHVTIYTDGGCSGNPGPGGWGCVVIAEEGDQKFEKRISGGEKSTTNNRMELSAAIAGLSLVKNSPKLQGVEVEIFTDSQYVKNGITSWINNWKKNGWKTAAKKPVLNKDLWSALDEVVSQLNVKWNWVKGHAGVEYNEICDQLCKAEFEKFRGL